MNGYRGSCFRDRLSVHELSAGSAFTNAALQHGLIAEEVAEVYPELLEYSETGEPFTVRYHLLGSMLLNEVQNQDRQIHHQQGRIAALEAQLQHRELEQRELAAQIAELKAQWARIAGQLKLPQNKD